MFRKLFQKNANSSANGASNTNSAVKEKGKKPLLAAIYNALIKIYQFFEATFNKILKAIQCVVKAYPITLGIIAGAIACVCILKCLYFWEYSSMAVIIHYLDMGISHGDHTMEYEAPKPPRLTTIDLIKKIGVWAAVISILGYSSILSIATIIAVNKVILIHTLPYYIKYMGDMDKAFVVDVTDAARYRVINFVYTVFIDAVDPGLTSYVFKKSTARHRIVVRKR